MAKRESGLENTNYHQFYCSVVRGAVQRVASVTIPCFLQGGRGVAQDKKILPSNFYNKIKFQPGTRSITSISFHKEQYLLGYNSKTLTLVKKAAPAAFYTSESISNYNSYQSDGLSEENFLEWFRGLVDGEGCFLINVSGKGRISFKFTIYLHKDDVRMLKYIAQRLKVGNVVVYEGDHFASYNVFSRCELPKIISIFDKYPLNTTKNLNFISFKKGYMLYFNRKSSRVSPELCEEILNIKNQMNKLQVNFKQQPDEHEIKITPY